MNPATTLLRELHSRGVELRVASGNLAFRPKNKVSPELQAAIVEHKAQLLRMLADAPTLGSPVPRLEAFDFYALLAGACYACSGFIYWRLRPDGEPVCAVCHPPGPPPNQIAWQRGRTHG